MRSVNVEVDCVQRVCRWKSVGVYHQHSLGLAPFGANPLDIDILKNLSNLSMLWL